MLSNRVTKDILVVFVPDFKCTFSSIMSILIFPYLHLAVIRNTVDPQSGSFSRQILSPSCHSFENGRGERIFEKLS